MSGVYTMFTQYCTFLCIYQYNILFLYSSVHFSPDKCCMIIFFYEIITPEIQLSTGWSTQEPQNSSVSVSPLLTLSKLTAKNTIKRRKIGLFECLREGKDILIGTPVDIEETRFFSIGCLLKVDYFWNYHKLSFPLSVTRQLSL